LKGRPSNIKLYSLIGLMVFFWSFNYIAAKVALREFPPLLLSCVRTSLAGLFMYPIYVWRFKSGPRTWTRSDVPLLIFLGVFGVALNQIFFVAGMSFTSVGHSALMIGLTPVLVLLIASILGQERVTARKMAGMAVAIGGIAVLNLAPSRSVHASVLGDFLVLMAALTFALYAVFGKSVAKRHDSITVNTFAYMSSGLVLAPLTWYTGHAFPFARVSLLAWASLIYMAAISSVLCYLIFYYVLAYVPASRVSASSYIQPVLATVMAIPLLHEPITTAVAMGGMCVLAGVYIVERH
jgi:drug/metabolite transporter (DMT)-like permease